MSGTSLGSPAYYEGGGQGAADQPQSSPFYQSFQMPTQSFEMPGSTFDPNQQLWQRPPDVNPSSVIEWAGLHYQHFPDSISFPSGIGPGYDFTGDLAAIQKANKAIAEYQRTEKVEGVVGHTGGEGGQEIYGQVEQYVTDVYPAKEIAAGEEAVARINALYQQSPYWLSYYTAAYPNWLPPQQKPIPKIKPRPYSYESAAHGEGFQGGNIGKDFGGQVGSGDPGTAVA